MKKVIYILIFLALVLGLLSLLGLVSVWYFLTAVAMCLLFGLALLDKKKETVVANKDIPKVNFNQMVVYSDDGDCSACGV